MHAATFSRGELLLGEVELIILNDARQWMSFPILGVPVAYNKKSLNV